MVNSWATCIVDRAGYDSTLTLHTGVTKEERKVEVTPDDPATTGFLDLMRGY
jgi:hypothetical protein